MDAIDMHVIGHSFNNLPGSNLKQPLFSLLSSQFGIIARHSERSGAHRVTMFYRRCRTSQQPPEVIHLMSRLEKRC